MSGRMAVGNFDKILYLYGPEPSAGSSPPRRASRLERCVRTTGHAFLLQQNPCHPPALSVIIR